MEEDTPILHTYTYILYIMLSLIYIHTKTHTYTYLGKNDLELQVGHVSSFHHEQLGGGLDELGTVHRHLLRVCVWC
jgi:hypothetical protein